MITLSPAAPQAEEVLGLGFAFHAFGNRAQLQGVRELDDCPRGSGRTSSLVPLSTKERSIFKMSMGSVLKCERDE